MTMRRTGTGFRPLPVPGRGDLEGLAGGGAGSLRGKVVRAIVEGTLVKNVAFAIE